MNDLAVITASASLLFTNGQTTERIVADVESVALALGHHVTLLPRWSDLIVHFVTSDGARNDIVTVSPMGVDMNKVAATISVMNDVCARRIDAAAAHAALEDIARRPPVSLARFALMAAAGAAALAVIFGAGNAFSVLLIAVSAGLGACLRRWLATLSRNAFVQPLCAALLAGAIGAVAARLHLSSTLRLVAVCPCMVLVPGPHLLNGAIDLVRSRITLGIARLVYAGMIILMICIGLLVGLALGGVALPASGSSAPVPFGYDVVAAGIAVAAYGSFFSLPWRTLPIPVVIGMLAHASRWVVITLLGANVQTGALVACLLAGTIVTPIANRLHLPFAAFAFASVVSLIPGVYLFRMAGGLVALSSFGDQASPSLLLATISDGSTAMLVLMAMTFGLIVPKMCIEFLFPHKAV